MDVSKFKMKDLAEVEQLTGLNMDEWESGSKVKLTMALAFVAGKKTNPELTWEQVEDMTVEEMTLLTGEDVVPKAITS